MVVSRQNKSDRTNLHLSKKKQILSGRKAKRRRQPWWLSRWFNAAEGKRCLLCPESADLVCVRGVSAQATLVVIKPAERRRQAKTTSFLRKSRFYPAARQNTDGNLGGCRGGLTKRRDEICYFYQLFTASSAKLYTFSTSTFVPSSRITQPLNSPNI